MTPHHPALEYLIALDERAQQRPDGGLPSQPERKPRTQAGSAIQERARTKPAFVLHCPQCAAARER